jgi:hypothetical protein
MATNYGICAILALPKLPERQLRVLLALETFTPGKDGWRTAGPKLLAKTAGLSVNTAIKARDELTGAGTIEYRPGNGRGNLSTYRIKVPNIAGDLSGPERYPSAARKGTQTGPVKVPRRNALTSANANAALKASALKPSALSPVVDVGERGTGSRAIGADGPITSQMIDIACAHYRERTGETLPRRDAERGLRIKLDGRDDLRGKPPKYVQATITGLMDDDLNWWLPTFTPARFEDLPDWITGRPRDPP